MEISWIHPSLIIVFISYFINFNILEILFSCTMVIQELIKWIEYDYVNIWCYHSHGLSYLLVMSLQWLSESTPVGICTDKPNSLYNLNSFNQFRVAACNTECRPSGLVREDCIYWSLKVCTRWTVGRQTERIYRYNHSWWNIF